MTWTEKGFQVMRSSFYNPSSLNNDYFQGEHVNNIIQATKGNRVISGLEVTPQTTPSLVVDIAAGSCYVNGLEKSLTASTLDLSGSVPATSGQSKYVVIYVDSTGAINKVEGSDATSGSQVYPEIPSPSVPLAVVVLTNGDTTIDAVDIGDLRMFVTQNEYVAGDIVVEKQIISKETTNPPFTVQSTALVTNLNADLLDGQEGSYYAPASHNHSGTYQPEDADLTAIAALSPAQNDFIVRGASAWENKTPAQVRSILNLEIGVDVQGYDADLAKIAGLTHADGNFIVSDGTQWVVESGATARASLGLSIGVDVQAYSAYLQAIVGLPKTDGNFIVADGTTYVAESGDTARTSLGLGTGDTPSFAGLNLTGNLDLNTNGLIVNVSTVDYTVSAANLKYLKDINGTGVTVTEYGYLSGVTSALQTQLDGKAATSHTHSQYLQLAWNSINIKDHFDSGSAVGFVWDSLNYNIKSGDDSSTDSGIIYIDMSERATDILIRFYMSVTAPTLDTTGVFTAWLEEMVDDGTWTTVDTNSYTLSASTSTGFSSYTGSLLIPSTGDLSISNGYTKKYRVRFEKKRTTGDGNVLVKLLTLNIYQ